MVRHIKFLVLINLIFFGLFNVHALPPVPAACTPSTLNYCCGFGITNVTFNTINNNSTDGAAGYSDFTTIQTSVFEGQTYLLSIQSVASSTQHYAAWIDFNNDGVFNDVTERVFTATSQMNTSGNITIPSGAVLNTDLRMRVAADYDFSSAPTPCTDLDYGQAEDYTVVITSNPNPPVPLFVGIPTTSCSGTVCFNDQSLNVPTAWLWNFGDGNSSTQQNPCYTYAADGVYTVSLTATNVNGSNTDSIVNYITINTAGSVTAPSCSPITNSYCCGYGIYQVVFNTINNSSADAVEGYQDFSCTNSTTLTEGDNVNFSITTGANNSQDSRVWIDFNNDGSFNNTNELVVDAPNTYNPTMNVYIPVGAVLNTPLRIRVSSDVVGSPQSACDANDFGQTEDYGLIILPNTLPPNPSFIGSPLTTCSDSVYFSDLSLNAPTSWLWDFGDGSSSTLRNPAHYYTAAGIYSVTLTVTNAFGQNVSMATNYININCNNTLIPTSGTKTVNLCNGQFYDDGGPSNNYSNNTNGNLVIQPLGASTVSLNFNFLLLDQLNPGDSVFVYDGPSDSSPILAAYFAFSPTIPSPITSSTGSITIKQKTDFMGVDLGFDGSWSCVVVSVPEIKLAEDYFNVFPNPAHQQLFINNDKGIKVEAIDVINMLGETVFTRLNFQDKNSIQLNVGSFTKGFYILKISTKAGVVVKKINIQ